MTTMRDLEKKLRKLDYHQARLYLFCNFISLMLITAYSIMMLSPTVQEVFPEGGDSRKQMQAIFVLAVRHSQYMPRRCFSEKNRDRWES